MLLSPDHPLRHSLNREIHARPTELSFRFGASDACGRATQSRLQALIVVLLIVGFGVRSVRNRMTEDD
jgi:hypothetical protein